MISAFQAGIEILINVEKSDFERLFVASFFYRSKVSFKYRKEKQMNAGVQIETFIMNC